VKNGRARRVVVWYNRFFGETVSIQQYLKFHDPQTSNSKHAKIARG
jgi:hypothetical protein